MITSLFTGELCVFLLYARTILNLNVKLTMHICYYVTMFETRSDILEKYPRESKRNNFKPCSNVLPKHY